METGSSLETVREEARSILEEMSQNLQLRFIRLMGYTLSKVFKRVFSSIFVNMEGLNRVRTKGVISTAFRHQHMTYTAVYRAKIFLNCFPSLFCHLVASTSHPGESSDPDAKSQELYGLLGYLLHLVQL